MDGSDSTLNMAEVLLLLGMLLPALSGLWALVPKRGLETAQKLSIATMVAGSLAGLAGSLLILASSGTVSLSFGNSLPFGPFEATADPLSALFLLPVFMISLCSAVYGFQYWPAHQNPRTIRGMLFFSGTLTASMAVLLTARNGAMFLIAWEIMAVSCFLLMSAENGRAEVREAGMLYIVTTHIGTLSLFALFSLLASMTGSFGFPSTGSLDGGLPVAAAVFATALLGFGLKAGIMPFHVWLPSAHAHAPSHISALMSGVLIKTGIYGLIRTLSLFGQIPLWWGTVILLAGVVSAILGVAFAIAQHDIKRLLAYHSIENIGIIAMGTGLWLVGRAVGNETLAVLGLAGSLLHVLNHATFKPLLFYSAGAVIHAAHTREIDLLGGLGKKMPWTATAFLIGAVAICGLPPLNGFLSEFFIYVGAFGGITSSTYPSMPVIAVTVPALALTGGLAAACFVKVYGVAMLGLPRSTGAEEAGEAGPAMRFPMGILAGICILIGLCPPLAAALLEPALALLVPAAEEHRPLLADLAPLWQLAGMNAALLVATLAAAFFLRRRMGRAPLATGPTWDCGYLRPAARMQYSASSFAQLLTDLFRGVLRPQVHRPALKEYPPGETTRFHSHVPEAVLDLLLVPFLQRVNLGLARVRRLQNGQINFYIMYICLTLVALLLWARNS